MLGPIPHEEWKTRNPVRFPAGTDDALPVGTEVFVYGVTPRVGEVVREPTETILGSGPAYEVLSDGYVYRCHPLVVAVLAEAQEAWHVLQGDEIVAGGPGISKERAAEIAEDQGAEVVQGVKVPVA